MSALSLSEFGNDHTIASERRPTFGFHRRIRDDPAFKMELPDDHRQWYPAAMKEVGNAIYCLVQEWTKEWLSGTHSDADAEVRLKGMVEEVIWGNAIWYGVGGWASRGDDGRVTNADFFLSVPSSYVLFTTTDFAATSNTGQVHTSSLHPSSYQGSFSKNNLRQPLPHSIPVARYDLPIV
jgi:hypothetical protein